MALRGSGRPVPSCGEESLRGLVRTLFGAGSEAGESELEEDARPGNDGTVARCRSIQAPGNRFPADGGDGGLCAAAPLGHQDVQCPGNRFPADGGDGGLCAAEPLGHQDVQCVGARVLGYGHQRRHFRPGENSQILRRLSEAERRENESVDVWESCTPVWVSPEHYHAPTQEPRPTRGLREQVCDHCPKCGQPCTAHHTNLNDAHCSHGLPRMGIHEWDSRRCSTVEERTPETREPGTDEMRPVPGKRLLAEERLSAEAAAARVRQRRHENEEKQAADERRREAMRGF